MNETLHYLATFVLQAACFLFLARFLLQACRVDFYNPISQGIVRATDPVLKPLRQLVPGFRNFDLVSLLAALLAQILLLMAITALQGGYAGTIGLLLLSAALRVALLCIDIFWWALMISIIGSWIAPGNPHPGLVLIHQITEPLLAPLRRLLPPLGGLDFSPIIAFLLLGLVQRMLPQIVQAML